MTAPLPCPAGVPEVEYELECNGMWVASCCGPSALAEIRHYAMQYASEGPCEIFVVTKYRAPLSAHLDAERSDKPRADADGRAVLHRLHGGRGDLHALVLHAVPGDGQAEGWGMTWCVCRGADVEPQDCAANAGGCQGHPDLYREAFNGGFMAGLRGNPIDEDFEGQADEAWMERPSNRARPTGDRDEIPEKPDRAHHDWHLCCEPTPEMLGAGYIDAAGERRDLTPDEMRSIWFRMHAEIGRDA